MEKIIDLHIHTNCSDGYFSPKEIIDMASNNGVKVMSITDHDTIEAYADDLFDYANSKGIKLIPGVEISTKVNKCGIHVLGYNFDLNNQDFRNRLSEFRNIRHIYLNDVSKKLESLGYVVNLEKLDKVDAVTKAHIALDVVENNKNRDLLLNNFGYIPAKGEFIEKVMNEGCPAYVEKKSVTPKDAAELIRSASGKVILAHPVAYKYEDNLSDEYILDIVNSMKANGIEANYVYIDINDNKINEIEHWNDFATRHNLITTIGSDFHNMERENTVVIGLLGEDLSFKRDNNDIIISNIE